MTIYQRLVLIGLLLGNLGLAAIVAFAWLAALDPFRLAYAAGLAPALPATTAAPGAGPLPGPASGQVLGLADPGVVLPVPTPEHAARRPAPLPGVEVAPLAAPPASLPASAEVGGVVGHRQSLPLSCESQSAVDWAAYFGFTIDEIEFHNGLPISDDPDRGFVGDVYGTWGQVPPAAYGVHAGPVARRLGEYGVPAQARRYWAWDELRAEIAAGRPVIAWVTGHVEPGESVIYQALDGRKTIVAPFEHTVLVTGYTATAVTVVDGAQVYTRPLNTFLAAWEALRNMAVVARR